MGTCDRASIEIRRLFAGFAGELRHSCNSLTRLCFRAAQSAGSARSVSAISTRGESGSGPRAALNRGIGTMALRKCALILLGLMLGGCMQATLEPSTDASFTPRDRRLLANPPYAQATIPQSYQRHIVDYHRAEAPGSIVVDTDARYLYYVLPNRKAIRYGVTVGEDALSFWGVARVGRKEEWPAWVPTADIKRRIPDVPDRVEGGAHNPLGARGIYLFQGN